MDFQSVDFSNHLGVLSDFIVYTNEINHSKNNPPCRRLQTSCFAKVSALFSSSFFSVITVETDTNYVEQWLTFFYQLIDDNCTFIRKRRQHLPYFYFSHTFHLLNKMRTAERRLAENWTKFTQSTVSRLRKQALDSIEMDTVH